jgi:hypothetical protein
MGSAGLRTKKAELEDRILLVEGGITTFSRTVVYVQE